MDKGGAKGGASDKINTQWFVDNGFKYLHSVDSTDSVRANAPAQLASVLADLKQMYDDKPVPGTVQWKQFQAKVAEMDSLKEQLNELDKYDKLIQGLGSSADYTPDTTAPASGGGDLGSEFMNDVNSQTAAGG